MQLYIGCDHQLYVISWLINCSYVYSLSVAYIKLMTIHKLQIKFQIFTLTYKLKDQLLSVWTVA